jgi:hypothetical protein
MRGVGRAGPLRWILEIHFGDRVAGFGGFQESTLFEDDELHAIVCAARVDAVHVSDRQSASVIAPQVNA